MAYATTKPGLASDIPSSITTNDVVETHLGTLRFFDSIPDQSTIEQVFDHLDFQRGVQAYLMGLPPVSQVAMRKALRERGPDNTTAVAFERLMDARSMYLPAHTNTIYWWIWLDMKSGPLVLEVPPHVLGLINDFWYNWVIDVGITGPDRGRGGKYLLLPPSYTGEVPDGYIVARSRTLGNMFLFRCFLVDGDPRHGVDNIKEHLRIYPLSRAADPPPMTFVKGSGEAFNTAGPANIAFFDYLNQVIQEEPSESTDPRTLGLFAAIGLRKGRPFAPDARAKAILGEAAKVGDATAHALSYRYREPAVYYSNSAWRLGYPGGYTFEQDGVRVWDGYISFFFAADVTPRLDARTVGKGSQYAGAVVDAHGDPLDGGKTYRLHLPPNIPVVDYWSVIVFDNQTRSILRTSQRFPMVGSQTHGLRVNPDHSIDVHFGPRAPAGMEHNWIQTIPGKGWNTLLRLYGPLESWFDKTWRPGEIEPIKPER